MSKSQSNKTNHLVFPSGRTVKACRNDVKKLKKEVASSGCKLSTSRALDIIAEKNGMSGGWHKAIHQLSMDDIADIYPVTVLYSSNGKVHSSTIHGMRPSLKDEDVKGLISSHKPSHFSENLRARVGSDRTFNSAVLNEKGQAYRTVKIESIEDSHAFHHGMYSLGYYQLVEDFIPDSYRHYDIVLAPDRTFHFQFPGWDKRPIDLTASLQMRMVLWLDYMDSEPPIDNNEDFCELRKNRPNWTFDMCTIYWKFAVELTGHPFNEAPNANIQKIIQYATLSAIKGFHTLIDKREKVAESYLPLTPIQEF
ncbi:hypothetical protein WOC09_07800 [Vibrio parahaemolyticus]|uniref:hypothetical protein n=1 Tax=Vibrio parahaemolyticus TaxID=670 RepID=UPI00211A686A|nr:hypothetical protein [Vibrio parahaemolyticus]MCQ9041486.1 hypothetical protein [Vibrio parahaemolyticus]